jgi:hypothetical protein
MTKMSKKDISNELLSRIISKGFESTATKEDLKTLATKAELAEIKVDLENIELKIGHLAYAFDVKDLKKRVTALEHKFGVK